MLDLDAEQSLMLVKPGHQDFSIPERAKVQIVIMYLQTQKEDQEYSRHYKQFHFSFRIIHGILES